VTVYVDDMRRPATVGRVRGRWSHLFADSPDELRTFARQIGLRQTWIQHAGTHREHYDVTDVKRLEALRRGARPLVYPAETGRYVNAKRLKDKLDGAVYTYEEGAGHG
jgi:hypothetical protein